MLDFTLNDDSILLNNSLYIPILYIATLTGVKYLLVCQLQVTTNIIVNFSICMA